MTDVAAELASQGVVISTSADRSRAPKGFGTQLLLSGEHTGGLWSCVEQTVPKGRVSDDHRHNREGHGAYVVSGSAQVRLGPHELTASTGDFIYIPAGVWHQFEGLTDETRLLVIIGPAGFEKIFDEIAAESAGLHELDMKYGVEVRP